MSKVRETNIIMGQKSLFSRRASNAFSGGVANSNKGATMTENRHASTGGKANLSNIEAAGRGRFAGASPRCGYPPILSAPGCTALAQFTDGENERSAAARPNTNQPGSTYSPSESSTSI